MKLNRKTVFLALCAAAFITAGIAVATGLRARVPARGQTSSEQAAAAALAHTGGGSVLETEQEGSGYEVKVRLGNGQKVEVRLDSNFQVVAQEADDEDEDGEAPEAEEHDRR